LISHRTRALAKRGLTSNGAPANYFSQNRRACKTDKIRRWLTLLCVKPGVKDVSGLVQRNPEYIPLSQASNLLCLIYFNLFTINRCLEFFRAPVCYSTAEALHPERHYENNHH
jgi:hypothetical protein